jgi:hypothetical protein
MKLAKDVKLSDFDKIEDGSHLIPIRCNITKKDQHENKLKIESFDRPRLKFNDLDSFLRLANINFKYSWSRIADGNIFDSTDASTFPVDSFIGNILNECADINILTKRIKELIGDKGKITLKIDVYDQTKVGPCSDLNVSLHLETPLEKKTKSRQNKPTTSKSSSCEGEISKISKKSKIETKEGTLNLTKRKNRVLDDSQGLETEASDIKTSNKHSDKNVAEVKKVIEQPKEKKSTKAKETPIVDSAIKHSDKNVNEANKKIKKNTTKKIEEAFKPKKRKSFVLGDTKDLDSEALAIKASKKHSDKNVTEVKKVVEKPKEKKSTKAKETPIVDSAINNNLQTDANTDNSVCQICQRKFASERGKNQHIRLKHKQA